MHSSNLDPRLARFSQELKVRSPLKQREVNQLPLELYRAGEQVCRRPAHPAQAAVCLALPNSRTGSEHALVDLAAAAAAAFISRFTIGESK